MLQLYFGTLPNYFGLALETYKYNADFDWYVLTDDQRQYPYPPNVFAQYTTLDRLKRQFQQHLEFPIALEHPYKLCDYRPLYGHLFADLLKGYDFWGHFDPDVIFGDLNKFINAETYRQYDKLCMKGHFSLYRNTPAINFLYRQKATGCLYFRDVLSSEKNWGFDEREDGVNAFFAINDLKIYTECPIADIYFRDYAMRLTGSIEGEIAKSRRSCFAYENGGVYRYYCCDEVIHREEFMYIHLMKRGMDICCCSRRSYLIFGNAFREMEPVTKSLLESANRNRFFYRIWDKLKFWIYFRGMRRACEVLFVERNVRKFAVKLLEKSHLMGKRRRAA